jgi:cytidylate kinase
MIVTIDGPAGAGKSTVARALARRLDFAVLDTGAMYRAVTLAAIRRHIDFLLADRLLEAAREAKVELAGDRTFLDGEDVSDVIRLPEISRAIRFVADEPRVREILVERQRRIAERGDYVAEGRDQGTVVFPEAPCKIFLTAGIEERARRRFDELLARGQSPTLEETAHEVRLRDAADQARPVGALRKAPDAVEIWTDGKSLEEVVAELERLVRSKAAS